MTIAKMPLAMARQSGWETGDKEDGILVSRLM
jgi:hypothetical protein